jgi:hypothetical protein
MGQINVLTGSQGQVRANCSARNAGAGGDELPWSVVETVVDASGLRQPRALDRIDREQQPGVRTCSSLFAGS